MAYLAVALLAVGAGCSDSDASSSGSPPEPTDRVSITDHVAQAPTTSTTAEGATTVTTTTTTTSSTQPSEGAVEVRVAVVRGTDDPATAGFESTVRDVLVDARGWTRAGFLFGFASDAPYTVELLEPDDAQEACRPYDVARTYSCQIGPRVILNADRWRLATPTWPGTVEEYRRMLVNHEVGHLLGQHHPTRMCSSPGTPAAVMAQQSKGMQGCAPSGWPLDWEIACAARHEEPLAPGYEPAAAPTCHEEDS